MENFTRVSDSIRMNKSLTASEKLFIGYLQTYQLSPDGTPTNNYCFLKQEELAEELGESLSTIKRMIISLSSKGIIFQSAARNYNKSGYQFKNRKATIFVDEYNPLPTELEVPKKEPKKVLKKAEVVTPEIKEEALQSMFGAQKSILEEIEESLEEDYDDEVTNYSNVLLTLNNQVPVSIPMEMVEYYNEIPDRRLRELKTSKGQFDFEFTLKNLYQSWKTTKELMSKYI
jgi:hypothetical protein